MRVVVAGAGGFIGGFLVGHLISQGHEVVAVDIKARSEWYQVHDRGERVADQVDLSDRDAAHQATLGADRVYNLAADMGGMGFIAGNRVDCMNTVLITANVAKAAADNGAREYIYASSACVYNDGLQRASQVSLKEADAWPADPEPGYGLEKLFGEQLGHFYRLEGRMETFAPRFHNVFGPHGTYDGGREKAPAAICRKVAQAVISGHHEIAIWGDGNQTRSFLFIDECIEGMDRIVASGHGDPINLGSSRLVTINELVDLVEAIAGIKVRRTYQLDKPQGVRGRCSDNTLIEQVTGWAPSDELEAGLEVTYRWIYDQMSRSA